MRSCQFVWTLVMGVVQIILPFSTSCDVSGCFCYEEFLSCHNLTSFPVQFPKNLEDLHFHDVTFDRIPSDAFRGLANLKTFKIYRGHVGIIERASFDGFKSLQTVYFDSVSIGEIQEHAFRNLRNISFSFMSGSIRTIRPYAFENIRNAHAFVFDHLNMTHIESHAFENISDVESISFRMCNITAMAPRCFHNFNQIGTFGFHTNNVDDLACGSIDSVIPAVPNRLQVYFYANTLSCNCDLAWIVNNPNMASVLPFSNRCSMPGTTRHVEVNLDDVTLAVLNCTRQDAICPEDETTTTTTTTTEMPTQAKQSSPSSVLTSTHTNYVTETLDMASSPPPLVSTDGFVDLSEAVTTFTASTTREPDTMTITTEISGNSTKTTLAPSVHTGSTTSHTGNEHSSTSYDVTTRKPASSTISRINTNFTTPSSVATETTQVSRSVPRTSAMPYHATTTTNPHDGAISGATSVTWCLLALTLNMLFMFSF